MLLGYDTNGLQNHRLDEALWLLARHGYEAVAITPDTMHLDPFRTTRDEVQRIAALLAQTRLVPVITTGARFVLDPDRKHEPTLMTRDVGLRERRLDFYDRCASLGRELGAGVLGFWSGIDRTPGQDSFFWLVEGVRKTCAIVRRHGLVPALEPEPGMAVATLADYARLREALGSEAPRLCLDIGHLHVIDEGDPAALIAEWAAHLALVQISDMKRGIHEHLPPGAGCVAFPRILRALESAGYRGALCFELSRSNHVAPETVALCRQVFLER